MQFAKVCFRLSALAGICALAGSTHATLNDGEMIIVHPFQWSYANIAKECEEVLGPSGFDAVQISQPAEHINRTDVWWAVYQPVNFWNYTTMTGDETELRDMIRRCNAAGVKVFADAVFNQRASGSGTGLGGTEYGRDQAHPFPDLDHDDFHHDCWGDIVYTDAFKVRHCSLSGMPDLATENDGTRTKIANYLKNLLNMGVSGFRIDAAKHMYPADIEAILAKAGNPPAYLEVIGAYGEAAQPEHYAGIPNSVVTEFKYCSALQNNIYDPKYLIQMDDSWYQIPGYASEVFIANHDNERGSAGTQYLTYQLNNWAFQLAQSFMIAYPHGTVRQVYSGYDFSTHDQSGPVWAERCQGGWHCEHRDSRVRNAVAFARATRGLSVTSKGAEGKLIWFTRGQNGFYALNAGENDVTKNFKVNMPDGNYCEMLQQQDKCGGQQIAVKDGYATIKVPARNVAAICFDATGRGFCGGGPVPPTPCDAGSDGKNAATLQCYCQARPYAQECVGDRYYSGTTNNWTFTRMDYDESRRSWSLDLDFTGEGDKNGVQRFKITDHPDWTGVVYGAKSGTQILCSDEVVCADIEVPSLKGSFNVSLTVDNAFQVSKNSPGDIVPGFNVVMDGLSASFVNTSAGDNLVYNWNFGDGTGSTEANPVHTYAKAGDYTVTMTASNDRKSMNAVQKLVIYGECKPRLSALYYAGSNNGWTFDPMTFNQDSCQWEIGLDLDGSSDKGGAQRFKVTDEPNWKGKVYGNGGEGKLCSDQSACKDVRIDEVGNYLLGVSDVDLSNLTWNLAPLSSDNHAPVASFDKVASGLDVTFTSTSTDADGDALTYAWNFGDGATGTGAVASHSYDAAGTYAVSLVASDGKTDSVPATAKVTVGQEIHVAKHDALFFAGTANSWGHDAMTFDSATGYWTIDLVLTGAGDGNGAQRFKITDRKGWTGTVWGDAGNGALCSNQASCRDVEIDEVGNYTLYVNDEDMTWRLESRGGYTATHSALYYAGTSNGWSHQAMTFDEETGNWYIDLSLSGQGDANGAQRFKITEQPNWNGVVWGRGNGNALCSSQSACGDVPVDAQGSYRLSVNDLSLTWSLEAN